MLLWVKRQVLRLFVGCSILFFIYIGLIGLAGFVGILIDRAQQIERAIP